MSTAIQWTDVTDNIITVLGGGWWCRMISPGCAHCYAAKLNQSAFFGGNKLAYSGEAPALELKREILSSWARQTKEKRHFVASMTDVFGDWVPQEWIFEFLDAMAAAPRQTFQVLTKRAWVMRQQVSAWLIARGLSEVPRHIWLGVSTENQQCADERIAELIQIPCVRFLSVEPLLGPVDLLYSAFNGVDPLASMPGIHWVIVGGESGPKARPCNIEWIRDIVRQCKGAGVPCFVKQLGASVRACDGSVFPIDFNHTKGGDIAEWPDDLRVREFPDFTSPRPSPHSSNAEREEA